MTPGSWYGRLKKSPCTLPSLLAGNRLVGENRKTFTWHHGQSQASSCPSSWQGPSLSRGLAAHLQAAHSMRSHSYCWSSHIGPISVPMELSLTSPGSSLWDNTAPLLPPMRKALRLLPLTSLLKPQLPNQSSALRTASQPVSQSQREAPDS